MQSFNSIKSVAMVFHPVGRPQQHFVKHHPNGRLVHQATRSEKSWEARPGLSIFPEPEEDVVVVGNLNLSDAQEE